MQLEEEIASASLNISDSEFRRIEAAETKAVSAFVFQCCQILSHKVVWNSMDAGLHLCWQ